MIFPSHRSWIGVISAMIVWALWFVVVYALSGVGCEAGWQQYDVPGGNLLSILMLACTLLALALNRLVCATGSSCLALGRACRRRCP
jgi:hypothetical protein